mmetsp:Transcript_16159/g.45837  ORF Transcript_16159/g.45837 Transcript_16159/m.45837 type:complete len:237 (+) Transcript_16159:1145-1855(+)
MVPARAGEGGDEVAVATQGRALLPRPVVKDGLLVGREREAVLRHDAVLPLVQQPPLPRGPQCPRRERHGHGVADVAAAHVEGHHGLKLEPHGAQQAAEPLHGAEAVLPGLRLAEPPPHVGHDPAHAGRLELRELQPQRGLVPQGHAIVGHPVQLQHYEDGHAARRPEVGHWRRGLAGGLLCGLPLPGQKQAGEGEVSQPRGRERPVQFPIRGCRHRLSCECGRQPKILKTSRPETR